MTFNTVSEKHCAPSDVERAYSWYNGQNVAAGFFDLMGCVVAQETRFRGALGGMVSHEQKICCLVDVTTVFLSGSAAAFAEQGVTGNWNCGGC